MSTELPKIFEYNDFRLFLSDYYAARHKLDHRFTRSLICRRLGLPNTRSYFTDLLNGKELTKTFSDRLVELLALKKEEAQYFRALVQFNQAAKADEREFYFDQMISLNRTPVAVVDPAAYSFYREWYHTVIRALLEFVNFKDEYASLARRLNPAITARQARESIRLLKSLGLIREDQDGYFRPTNRTIATGPYVRDELVKQYQGRCIDLAKRALQDSSRLPRNLSTMTISISPEGYKRIERQLQKFKSEIRSLAHKDENPAALVYQLNIQLFPTSRQGKT